jgi:hypothetical protein
VPTPYDINPWRLAVGVVLGAIAAIIYYCIPFGEAWPLIAVFAVPIGGVVIAVGVLPIYVLMRRWQRLSAPTTILIGGALATLPYAIYIAYFITDPTFRESFPHSLSDGRLTSDALTSIVWAPLWFFGGGALGGAVAWVTGIGFRRYPQRRAP